MFIPLLAYIEQDNLLKSSLTASGDDNDNRNGTYPTYSQWHGPITTRYGGPGVMVKAYVCPSDYTIPVSSANGSHSSYGQNGQVFREGQWAKNTLMFPASFSDGTSSTIFYTDKLAKCNSGNYPDNYWPDWGPVMNSSDEDGVTGPNGTLILPQIKPTMSGGLANCSGSGPSSPHTAGINVGLADGSVRFVSAGISVTTWWAALTPNGGDIPGNDW